MDETRDVSPTQYAKVVQLDEVGRLFSITTNVTLDDSLSVYGLWGPLPFRHATSSSSADRCRREESVPVIPGRPTDPYRRSLR